MLPIVWHNVSSKVEVWWRQSPFSIDIIMPSISYRLGSRISQSSNGLALSSVHLHFFLRTISTIYSSPNFFPSSVRPTEGDQLTNRTPAAARARSRGNRRSLSTDKVLGCSLPSRLDKLQLTIGVFSHRADLPSSTFPLGFQVTASPSLAQALPNTGVCRAFRPSPTMTVL